MGTRVICWRNHAPIGVAVLVVLVMAACGADPGAGDPAQGGRPEPGATTAPDGERAVSLDDVVTRIRAATGSCLDARAVEADRIPDELDDIFDLDRHPPFVAAFRPTITAWGECTVDAPDGSTLRMELLLFQGDAFVEAQRVWKAHTNPRPPENDFVWGNGFALYSPVVKREIEVALDVTRLRCDPVTELGVRKVPADVEGCFFVGPA